MWHRECLWPQELPPACMLVLAAEDDLVPSKLVREMLHQMNHPCEVRHCQTPEAERWFWRLCCAGTPMRKLAWVVTA